MENNLRRTVIDIINTGNKLLRKGIIFYGMDIKPEQLHEYNIKLRKLKRYCYENNQYSTLPEFHIVDYEDLVRQEDEHPPGFWKRWLMAYWTGDIIMARQTTIKNYIRQINMELDIYINKQFR